MKLLVVVMGILFAIAALGCGNTRVSSALQIAQISSESAQSTFHLLVTEASNMIQFLPEEQRASKFDALTQLALKGDQIFQAEQDTIAVAIRANDENFDVTAFVESLASVMADLVSLAEIVGVRSDVIRHAQRRMSEWQAAP